MPELTPTGAVDVVRRQVRRVRRRKNLYELQRTLYWMIAAGTGAATLLLPLVLFAPAGVFAIAAASALVLLTGIALLLVGATRRCWLARRGAVAWIETRGALAGRLRTLLELAERPAAASGFFHALLVAEIGRDLATWTPRRLVPRGVPRAAGATALVTTTVFVVALRLAALTVPATPSVTFSDRPLAGERASSPSAAMMGERVVVAPGMPQPGDDQPSRASDDARDGDSTLARLADGLQENVRQQVWGKAWERVRDALARAGTSSGSGGRGATRTEEGEEVGTDESAPWEIARAPSGELTRRRRPGIGRQPAARSPDPAATDTAAAEENHQEAGNGASDGGTGGGAGNGTSPDLFGAPSADPAPATGSFELSLAARMRAGRATDRRGGTAPNADPDARPELAAEQRRESAAHRMAVPAAYETVVREVFAHRRPESPPP